jgi:hypothetical protein
MTDVADFLRGSRTVLLVDWPDRDVPDTLARAGFDVVSNDGPSADEYNAYEVVEGEVRIRRVGRPPERVDFVYTHRPVDELADIVEQACALGARAVWIQSGLDASGARDTRGCWMAAERSAEAREIVESAGLTYIESPYIADAVRRVSAGGPGGGEA